MDFWEAENTNGEVTDVVDHQQRVVCTVYGGPGLPVMPRARLIAAAPALLDACKRAFEAFGNSFSTDHDKAKALSVLEMARHMAEKSANVTIPPRPPSR